jgi:hypothetical protein
MTTRYVLRYAYNAGPHGYVPVEDDGRTHYLYKSVTRGRHGFKWTITERVDQARTWATQKGAEGYLAAKLTNMPDKNGVASSFVVEEVAA